MALEQKDGMQLDIRQLQKFIGIISERKYLSLILFLCISTAIMLAAKIQKNVYEAKSVVLIEHSTVLAPLLQGMAVQSRADALISTLRDNILSRNLVEKAIKKIDLDTTAKNQREYEDLVRWVQKDVRIRVTRGSGGPNMFEVILAAGKPPETVRDLVNALVSTFIEENMGSSRGETYKSIEFIGNQILYYRQKLDEADAELRAFQERNPGILGVNQNVLVERIRGYESRISEEELTLKSLLREKESIEGQLKGERPLAITEIASNSTPGGRLAELKGRLAVLTARYTERHPEVIALKNEIEEIEKGDTQLGGGESEGTATSMGVNPIYQQLKERLSQAQTNIDMHMARIDEIRRRMEQDQKRLQQIPKENEAYTQLTRGRQVYQNMYDTLMAKLESARVSKEMEETDKGESFRVLDPAILPGRPLKPNRVLIMAVGFVLAIGTAAGVPIGIELLRPTFRDIKTTENTLGAMVLGAIPHMMTGAESFMIRRRWFMALGASGLYVIIQMMVWAREFWFQKTGVYILF